MKGPTDSVQNISRREQRKEEYRRRVLAAARDLFETHGMNRTSVEDILREAGVSRATFYSHFTGRTDVGRAMAAEMWDRTNALYAEFASLPDVTLVTVRGWLARVFDAWQGEREQLDMLIKDLLPLLVADTSRRHEEMVRQMIGDGRHWTGLSPAESRRRAYLLIYQLERAMQAYHLEGWEEEREPLLDTLALSWIWMFGPPAAT